MRKENFNISLKAIEGSELRNELKLGEIVKVARTGYNPSLSAGQ